LDRRLDELGATRATGSTRELLEAARSLSEIDAARPYLASEALQEMREDKQI
jgi:hypothetical protein